MHPLIATLVKWKTLIGKVCNIVGWLVMIPAMIAFVSVLFVSFAAVFWHRPTAFEDNRGGFAIAFFLMAAEAAAIAGIEWSHDRMSPISLAALVTLGFAFFLISVAFAFG